MGVAQSGIGLNKLKKIGPSENTLYSGWKFQESVLRINTPIC